MEIEDKARGEATKRIALLEYIHTWGSNGNWEARSA